MITFMRSGGGRIPFVFLNQMPQKAHDDAAKEHFLAPNFRPAAQKRSKLSSNQSDVAQCI